MRERWEAYAEKHRRTLASILCWNEGNYMPAYLRGEIARAERLLAESPDGVPPPALCITCRVLVYGPEAYHVAERDDDTSDIADEDTAYPMDAWRILKSDPMAHLNHRRFVICQACWVAGLITGCLEPDSE